MEKRPGRNLVLLLISATAVFTIVSLVVFAQGVMALQ